MSEVEVNNFNNELRRILASSKPKKRFVKISAYPEAVTQPF
jgi:hypothetical protein